MDQFLGRVFPSLNPSPIDVGGWCVPHRNVPILKQTGIFRQLPQFPGAAPGSRRKHSFKQREMRKERIVTPVRLCPWSHPAVEHHLLDCEFARYTEQVSCDGHTSGLVTGASLFIQDLGRPEVAPGCNFHVPRKRHC